MKRIDLVVRTSYDVFVKPTYALLKKERTDILRLIVRSFFVKLAPGHTNLRHIKSKSIIAFEQSHVTSYLLEYRCI